PEGLGAGAFAVEDGVDQFAAVAVRHRSHHPHPWLLALAEPPVVEYAESVALGKADDDFTVRCLGPPVAPPDMLEPPAQRRRPARVVPRLQQKLVHLRRRPGDRQIDGLRHVHANVFSTLVEETTVRQAWQGGEWRARCNEKAKPAEAG